MQMRKVVIVSVLAAYVSGGALYAAQDDAMAELSAYTEVVDVLVPSGGVNVITFSAPRALRVADLGLREAGLLAGRAFRVADELRIFTSKELASESPKARLWINDRDGRYWYHTGGAGPAENHVLEKGEMLVVITRASRGAITWKNPLRALPPVAGERSMPNIEMAPR